MRVLTLNPGSTSTKVALFEDDACVFKQTVRHASGELARFSTLAEQLPFRVETIATALCEADVDATSVDAVVGRGGGLLPMRGGVYRVTDLVLRHSVSGVNGVTHPANLGPTMAYRFAKAAHAQAFVVNPPDTDELCDLARVTGIAGVYRHVHLHALNLKETAIRHAKSLGKRYEECNLIVCHLGGASRYPRTSRGE